MNTLIRQMLLIVSIFLIITSVVLFTSNSKLKHIEEQWHISEQRVDKWRIRSFETLELYQELCAKHGEIPTIIE